jgi:two-component system response regulator YesN
MYKVLLVDDEPRAIEGLQIMIDWEGLGFELCGSCGNGAEALELVDRLTPDLVITDIRMPIMDGLQLIAEVMRKPGKPVKMIILSAYSEFEYAKKAMKYGIKHYILKPIITEDVSELLQMVFQELKEASDLLVLNDIIHFEGILSDIVSMLYDDSLNISLDIQRLHERNSSWHFIQVETEEGHRQQFRDVARHYARNHKDAFMIDLGADVFGFVYGHNGSETIESFTNGLLQTLWAVSINGFAIAVSSEASSLHGLKECYRTAQEAMNHKFFQATPDIIYYSDIKDQAWDYRFGEMNDARLIIESLENLDKIGLLAGFESFFVFFQTHLYTPEMVKMIVIHIVYRSIALVKEMDGNPEELLKKHGISYLENNKLSLREIITMLKGYCDDCIDLLLKLQRDQVQGVIHEVNVYIKERYRESITLKELAERFYINPVYLGQLFLKKNGIAFNVYLHDLRIAEAAQLIRNTEMKTHQIAEQVGYLNYDKFLKQFEKRLEMKPNVYKKNSYFSGESFN